MTHTATAPYEGLGLKPLVPEKWGRRLARARAEAGYNLREVEDLLSPHVSRSAVNRLEELEDAPTGRRDRGRAFLVLVLYGIDPGELGITPDDRPPAIDVRALSRLRSDPNGWLRGTAASGTRTTPPVRITQCA